MTSTPPDQRPGGRNIAPIRWPKPEPHTWFMLALWVLGIIIGVLVPGLIVPPTQDNANAGRALLAFSFTVVGVAVMVFAGIRLYRRHREGGLLVFTTVPSATVLLGGFMFLGLKLFT